MIGIKHSLLICLLISATFTGLSKLRSAHKPSTHRCASKVPPVPKIIAAVEFKLQTVSSLANLQALLQANKFVAVYVSASWASGKLSINTLRDLAQKNPDVRFFQVALESGDEILEEYPVNNFPAFLLFKEAELINSVEGNNLVEISQAFMSTFSS